ncbi:MAG: class I SAM-dependent methyltransferase [Eggerthellaceae bacterium]|nr:class I SAM-dependent methyltransferase [Eggerthellaceae bacterium]
MDKRIAETLIDLNTRFYRSVAYAFSETRLSPWSGWEYCIDKLKDAGAKRILDVAAGNMRFEKTMQEHMPDAYLYALDNCPELAQNGYIGEVSNATFANADICRMILNGNPDFSSLVFGDNTKFDAAVSFAFMHHIPSYENRIAFLKALASCVKPRGLVIVSLWKFMKDADIASSAQKATAAFFEANPNLVGTFDKGDYLLGWQNLEGIYRYCHHFSEEEIADIVKDVSLCLSVKSTYESDGRSHRLNAYLVFETTGCDC